MRIDGDWFDVSIRNLSSRGLMAKTNAAVSHRSYVELHRGDHTVIGRVVWTRGEHFGLRTQDRIDIAGMMGRTQAGRFQQSTSGASMTIERRAKPRDGSMRSAAYRAELSRAFGSKFQFIAIGAAGAFASVAVAVAIARLLHGAVAPTMAALGG